MSSRSRWGPQCARDRQAVGLSPPTCAACAAAAAAAARTLSVAALKARPPSLAPPIRPFPLPQAAWKAVEYVKSGMVVGLGTGSTAAFAVDRIGQLLKEGGLTDIVGVPTSVRTYEQAKSERQQQLETCSFGPAGAADPSAAAGGGPAFRLPSLFGCYVLGGGALASPTHPPPALPN